MCCHDANLVDPEQSHALCRKVLAAALAPDRSPHPDQNWDLVSVYAGLQKLERGEACVKLGLAIKIEPKLTAIEQEKKNLTAVIEFIQAARQRGMWRVAEKALLRLV